MPELSVVGKRLPRVDGVEKVTGQGLFTVDVHPPEMLWGKMLRSPFPHARVLREEAPKVHAQGNLCEGPFLVERGDVRKGFAEADHVIEETYETSRVQHAFLEPYVCALLAQKAGRPVRMEYSREEVFSCGKSRHPSKIWLKQGFKSDGTLVAREGRVILGKASFEPSQAPPFAAQFAEVEVDIETGQVRVLRLVAAHDVGLALNPTIVEGQIEGALHHGIGYALTERMAVENGVVLNPSFADYKLLTALDMPSVEALFVESLDPTGPFGAKGVGEPGLVATAPAIANAIYHAVGVRIRSLPITPEKVLRALKELPGKTG